MNTHFTIGEIVNTHGVAGEIRVMPSTDDPSRFTLLKTVEVYFGDGGAETALEYTLESARPHKNVVVLKLKGVGDRDAAEELVGGIIKIPPALALPLDEDEYYLRDLIDMAVVTEDGEALGTLAYIIQTGANDVYAVRPHGITTDKNDILIPAIKQCILDVDLRARTMTVHLLDGLRD